MTTEWMARDEAARYLGVTSGDPRPVGAQAEA